MLFRSGQFDEGAFRVLRLPKVTSVEQVKSFVGPRVDADHRDIAVFHTIVDPALRARVLDYLGMLHIRSVDLMVRRSPCCRRLPVCRPRALRA